MFAINLNYKVISYSLLAFLGVLVRFIDLSNRAVHHDESLHGYFSFITSQGDYYNHNPLTHGMFLFNVLSSSFWLITDNDFILRLPFALSGVVLIFVPLLLKKEIGFLPCFIFSLLITFSPSIAYFSRFARNDIFMALTLLILVIAIFKYIKTSKIVWIYVSVTFLSLGYTIKESMYINVFGILIFLFLYSFTDIKNIILGKLNIKNISNETRIFIIIFSLSLPLAAPLFSIFQSSLGFTLATPDGYPGVPPGLPTGLGIVISWIISFSLLGISIFIGIYSDKKTYIYSFLIFLVVYISMFTTFMIAPQGLVTGQWQSLGYWLAQHEVARGSQPYYYYLLILFTNEFLPFLFGIPLSVYYLIRGEFLSKFVSFWAIFSLISFSIAGEKMPWLTVNLTLPFIFVFSIFSREVIKYLKDRSYQVLLFQFISAFIVLILTLKILFTNYQLNENLYYDILYLLTSLIIISGINLYLKNIFSVKSFSYSLLSVIAILSFFLTIRTTNIVVFDLSDEPKDMLIYTQTSQNLHHISKELDELYLKKSDLRIAIDTTDGFSWPWMWYLRGKNEITWFSDMNYESLNSDFDVIITSKKNIDKIETSNYKVIREFPHRQWFPENIYRNKRPEDLLKMATNMQNRIKLKNYILYREFQTQIGSSDGVFLKSYNLDNFE